MEQDVPQRYKVQISPKGILVTLNNKTGLCSFNDLAYSFFTWSLFSLTLHNAYARFFLMQKFKLYWPAMGKELFTCNNLLTVNIGPNPLKII